MAHLTPFIAWWCLVTIAIAAIIYGSKGPSYTNLDKEMELKMCLKILGGKEIITEDKMVNLFCLWLQDIELLHQAANLKKAGLNSLDDIHRIDDDEFISLLGSDADRWVSARLALPTDPERFTHLKNDLIDRIPQGTPSLSKWTFVKGFMKGVLILMLTASCTWIPRTLGFLPQRASISVIIDWFVSTDLKQAVLQWLSGQHALANNAKVEFHWEEPCIVGNTVSFSVQFFQRWSGRPYPISDMNGIRINVRQGTNKIAVAVQFGGILPAEVNQVKASFTVRKAGQYFIDVHMGSLSVIGSPFVKHFLPGPPEASKTTLVRPSSMVVCTVGIPHQLFLEPRDEYGNYCSWTHRLKEQEESLKNFSLEAFIVGSHEPVRPIVQWLWVEIMHRLLIHVSFDDEGIYVVRLKLHNSLLNKSEFNMIALSRSDCVHVEKAMKTKAQTYETKLISINGEKWTKNKKVFCALSPRQISLKEYFLGLIPKRLATFRLCPSTKFTFRGSSNKYEALTLIIEDGSHLQVEVVCKEAHIMAASFARYLIKNIGGSETFIDKQAFFYKEINRFHQKKSHDKLVLRIERDQLLQSSMKATKSFSTNDWCKNFEISFIDEQGLDWGGLRREWIELLSIAIFDRRHSGMFTSFSDNVQSLVHPNPKMPENCKLKHYEFAGKIVGKCLYESSLGATYRQLVKARFSRSFLAQLIGLRITYKYFEQDDPQLFLSKIKYIEENDVADMELTFSEDEYDEKGQLLRTVELIPGGAQIGVNNNNKHRYLDALAQHRLVNCVSDQIDSFLHGLNEMVPDNLLSIFDEYELELLICGTSEYSVTQLKEHHIAIGGSSPEFCKVLSWFWTAVTNFGDEELSRLLQFTTGSSQLPPGGLAELSPKLQISASPSFGTLPTAHTCFNQLCLPDYESYEHFEKALLLAINEGSEGFGLV